MDIGPHLSRLDRLIRRGRGLLEELANDASPGRGRLPEVTGSWQRDCAAAIHQLSGNNKAHWLSRAYSEALLVRSTPGHVVEEATPAEIVTRVVSVLEQAASSLSGLNESESASGSRRADPPPHRFDFVHNRELRPFLEQAYRDSRCALEHGDFGRTLMLSCGVLESIITDALEHRAGRPDRALAEWSFEKRIAVAEDAGLLRGCGRLPPVARSYRDLTDAGGELRRDVTVSERDARVTGQVLHVVMRDLDPGR